MAGGKLHFQASVQTGESSGYETAFRYFLQTCLSVLSHSYSYTGVKLYSLLEDLKRLSVSGLAYSPKRMRTQTAAVTTERRYADAHGELPHRPCDDEIYITRTLVLLQTERVYFLLYSEAPQPYVASWKSESWFTSQLGFYPAAPDLNRVRSTKVKLSQRTLFTLCVSVICRPWKWPVVRVSGFVLTLINVFRSRWNYCFQYVAPLFRAAEHTYTPIIQTVN